MDKLPKVFPVPVNKKISNNNEMFYSKDDLTRTVKDKNHDLNISSKINRIFNSPDFVYKKTVTLITNSGSVQKTIVGKVGNYLLTDTNESIKISDLIDIQ